MRQEDFEEWRQHPVTRELFRLFDQEILEQARAWSHGSFLNDRTTEMGVLGRCAGYYALLELDWEAVKGLIKEEQEPQNGQ